MGTYRIKRGDSLTKIAKSHGLEINELLAVNPRYKADPNRISVGDILQIPEDGDMSPVRPVAATVTAASVPSIPPLLDASSTEQDWFRVPIGQLTFDAEGVENPRSKYHSRRPHVPGNASGVTIGRGYDMKHRSKDGILKDMSAAAVRLRDAKRLSGCSGYSGSAAKGYVKEKKLRELDISPESQYRLFLATYEELAGDVVRICVKADVIAKYGETDWDGLDPVVRDIVVDLRYRGDYTPATRAKVQPIVVQNDSLKLRRLMANERYWIGVCNVPRDRFRRRRDYFSK